MDWILGKIVDESHCQASVGDIKVNDLVFADVAVPLSELLEVPMLALEVLHEEAKQLGLKVSRPEPRPVLLEACWVAQFSLFMHVVRMLKSPKFLHTLVV